jgi:hypothetical protein
MKKVSGEVIDVASEIVLSETINKPSMRKIDFGMMAPVNDVTALIVDEAQRALKEAVEKEKKHDDPAR